VWIEAGVVTAAPCASSMAPGKKRPVMFDGVSPESRVASGRQCAGGGEGKPAAARKSARAWCRR